MTIDDQLLYELLQWAIGNRGRKDVNPYTVPEIKAVLKAIAIERGYTDPERNYFDALDAWMPVGKWKPYVFPHGE